MQSWQIPGSRKDLIIDVIQNAPGVRIDRGSLPSDPNPSRFDKTSMWLRGKSGESTTELYLPVYVATRESPNPFVITFKEPIYGADIKCTLPKGKPGFVRLLGYLDTDPYPVSATLQDSTAVPVEMPDFDLKLGVNSPGVAPRIVKLVIFRQASESQPDVPADVNDCIFGTTGWLAEVP